MSLYSGIFKYSQLEYYYRSDDFPFINTDGSFTTLERMVEVDGEYVIVSWSYVFDDSINSSVDGFKIGRMSNLSTTSIIDFGNIPLSRQGFQFYEYTGNFPTIKTNIPTLLSNTSCNQMFRTTHRFSKFNQDISSWDLSTTKDTLMMFDKCTYFNQDISSWDVSNVTDMREMFRYCENFNQNLSNWNVSNVLAFNGMFNTCYSFNQNIGNWDVSKGNTFYAMFRICTLFNQDLGRWDISNATNMELFFDSCRNLDSVNYGNTLKGWYELSNTPFNIILGAPGVFYNYSNQIYQNSLISEYGWNIEDNGLVTFEYGVNYDNNNLIATSFNSDTLPSTGAINFRPNTVSISSSAFEDQTSIISVYIPSSMTSIGSNAFKGCSGITNISFFNNSTCEIISESAFEGCTSLFNITIPSSITTIEDLSFNNCSSMQYAIMTSSGTSYTYTYTTETDKTIAMQNFLTDTSSWTQATVTTTSAVSDSDAQITIVESPIEITNDTRSSFANNIFIENSSSFSSSVNSFVTDNTVLNIPNTIPSVSTVRVFNSNSNNGTNSFAVNEITTVPDIGTYVIIDTGSTVKINIIDSIDNSSHYINVYKDSLTQSTIYIDGSSTGETYNTGDTVTIFNNSITIGSISQLQNPQGTFQYTLPTTDYNALDSPFINTDGSFTTLTKITSISDSNTIVSWAYTFNDNGTTNDGLYLNGTITTPENMAINDFDSIPLSRQGSQFKNYTGLFPLVNTNMPTILSNTSYDEMFQDATSFNQDISSWDISNVTSMNNMLNNTALSVDNYNLILNTWSSQEVQSNVTLGAEKLKYSSEGKIGRNILINDYKWDIKGDSDNNSIITIPNIDIPPPPELIIKKIFISSTIFNEY